jgi:hypothetical protein
MYRALHINTARQAARLCPPLAVVPAVVLRGKIMAAAAVSGGTVSAVLSEQVLDGLSAPALADIIKALSISDLAGVFSWVTLPTYTFGGPCLTVILGLRRDAENTQ